MKTTTKLVTIALLGATLDVRGAPTGALQANVDENLAAAEQKLAMYEKQHMELISTAPSTNLSVLSANEGDAYNGATLGCPRDMTELTASHELSAPTIDNQDDESATQEPVSYNSPLHFPTIDSGAPPL